MNAAFSSNHRLSVSLAGYQCSPKHKNAGLVLVAATFLSGFVTSQWSAIQAETNTASSASKGVAPGITNGMSRGTAEVLLPAFTNRVDAFVNPGGIVSAYWTKDGRRVRVIYDWTGSSWGDPKASLSNRVIQTPILIDTDKKAK